MEKEELIDFIDELVKKRVDEATYVLPQIAQSPPLINVQEIIDGLHFDLTRNHYGGFMELHVIDRYSGYRKVFPLQSLS